MKITDKSLNQPRRSSPFGSSFIILATLGVLVTNFATCLHAFNVAEYLQHIGESYVQKRSPVSNKICETPGCVRAASSILNNMDPSAEPCDDFYQFTCGTFIKESVIPDEKSRMDVFSQINDKLQEQLRVSIEDDTKADDPRAFKLLNSYYKSCMDKAQIEKTSEKDFREILKKLGGWPVLEGKSWDESTFDWKKTIYQLRNSGYGIGYFIDFGVQIDMKNNSRRVINLDQTDLGLPQEYLSKGLEEKVVQAYFNYMVEFAELFGANREEAKAELAESLNFEIELAKISLPREKRRNMTDLYNPMFVYELQSKYSGVPWMEYLNRILAPHSQVLPSEKVIVVAPSFFSRFTSLVARTPRRVLANYVMWRVAASSAGHLSERVQRIQSEFDAATSGTSVKPPRWKECVDAAAGNLGIAVGALYARRHFDESAKASAVEIINDIRKSFENLLKQVNWMDPKTRSAALEKLSWIRPFIAYPDEFLDNRKLDGYYQYLKIYPESFLKNKLSIQLFELANEFEKLRKPVNKTDWTSHGQAAIVNAFYEPTENSIQFPAGILQGNFFTKDRPKYLNYGAIGFVMGHEMTHGFDDEGRQFDKDGNLAEWWEPETKQKYLQRAQCIIDQYSNYTVKEVGLKINGINTQGENIADNGGIKEAYLAYNAWEQRNGPEPRLPGLHYTSQQMFWIAAGNVWCNKYRPEALKSRVLTDPHSPGEFRVIGPLSNMPEFAKDFNCPLGSFMNPVKKCTVW